MKLILPSSARRARLSQYGSPSHQLALAQNWLHEGRLTIFARSLVVWISPLSWTHMGTCASIFKEIEVDSLPWGFQRAHVHEVSVAVVDVKVGS